MESREAKLLEHTVMEVIIGRDQSLYQRIIDFYLMVKRETSLNQPTMIKKNPLNLLYIAHSDREHECINFAVYKSSGLTPTAVR